MRPHYNPPAASGPSSIRRKSKTSHHFLSYGLAIVIGVSLVLVFTQPHSSFLPNLKSKSASTPAHLIPTVTPSGNRYTVTGQPTISAAFIDRILSAYKSPTSGKGKALYGLGVKYGIDPVYAMAFFLHESRFGTMGEATVTLALGNERCVQDRPCIDLKQGGYAQMESWEDGFEHWYMLIRDLYVRQWHRVTVAQIIPKYAPGFDGNNESAYIASVEHAVDTWRSGHIFVS